MINRDDFFTAKANGSLWDVAVSIKRGNPLPLDADSIFESYSALETYASGVLAYPGQVVAVVEADSTGIYYIDQAGAIQPVGVIPSGDSKSIEVTEEGMISLVGAAAAQDGTLPMIENGALVWKTLEDIGAGDGNDNTTYDFSFADEKITITPKFNGIAQDAVELDLSAFVTADELATELAKLTDTTYSVADGDKVLKMTDTVLSTEIGLKHENGMVSLTGINGEVIAEFSDADFVKDSVLEDVAYDADTKKIIFTWKTEGDTTKTDEVDVADFVQVYTAGVGLNLEGNQFAVKLASGSETFLTVNADGLKLDGVQSAIDSAKQAAIDDAASKYATTETVTQLEENVESRLDTLEAIDYATKDEVTAVETIANNAAVKTETLEGKINEITAVGGEPNVIETIQVNGVSQSVANKTVNIAVPTALSGLEGWAALDERVTAAKTQADAGVSAASVAQATADENKNTIAGHETHIVGLETLTATHTTDIATLKQADINHAAEYEALNTTVSGHTATLATKADKTVVDGVLSRVSTNETAIKTLNETTVPALQNSISTKANSSDVYTKEDIGTLPEDKTVLELISEAQTSATYDDTEVRSLITAETSRATEAESLLSTRVAKAEAFLNEANLDTDDGTNNVIDTLKEIQDYITNDQTGASNMLASINANTAAIEAINEPTTGVLAQAKAYTDAQIGAIPVATQGVLGLIKYDDDTIKKNDSDQLYVAKVSTDLLVNGTQTLVLSGGSASE